jgi:hypothetical protein
MKRIELDRYWIVEVCLRMNNDHRNISYLHPSKERDSGFQRGSKSMNEKSRYEQVLQELKIECGKLISKYAPKSHKASHEDHPD